MKRRGQRTAGTSDVRLFFPVICLLLSVFCASTLSAYACPGCSEALFDPAQGAARVGTLRGYLISIVMLLGIPVLMIAWVAMAVARASRRRRRESSTG